MTRNSSSSPYDDRSLTLKTVMSRWQGAPRSARITALAVVVVLVYGTAVHVVQLVASGIDPYPGVPGWLRTYFTALTVLDPLAAVLQPRGYGTVPSLSRTTAERSISGPASP